MNIQEIELVVRPDGTVTSRVRGVKGPVCLGITAGLERLLGGDVTREATAEMHEAEEQGDAWREQHA